MSNVESGTIAWATPLVGTAAGGLSAGVTLSGSSVGLGRLVLTVAYLGALLEFTSLQKGSAAPWRVFKASTAPEAAAPTTTVLTLVLTEPGRERFKRLRIGTLVTLYFNVLTSETLETSLVLQAEPAAGTDQENRKAFTLTTSNALAALN